jgi:hypothetical protein
LSQDDETQRFVTIALLIAVFGVVAGVVLVNGHFRNERVRTASREHAEKVRVAKESLDRENWDDAIRLLEEIKALTNSDDLDDAGKQMLSGVDRLLGDAHRSTTHRQAQIDASQATTRADELIQASERDIRNTNFPVAEKRLRQYLASPGASDRARAKWLLDAIRVATSDESAIEFLVLLPDAEFSQFVADGSLTSLDLTGFDSLRANCQRRLESNLSMAQKKREDLQGFREREARFAERSKGEYDRDTAIIMLSVLADTIVPAIARFCDRFEVTRNNRGNKVYVGWYRSKGLNGSEGRDTFEPR